MPLGVDIPEVDAAAVEQRIVDATRTWDEDLVEASAAGVAPRGRPERWPPTRKALPEAYKEDFGVEIAAADLDRIEALGDSASATVLHLYQDPQSKDPGERRFKLYRRGPTCP